MYKLREHPKYFRKPFKKGKINKAHHRQIKDNIALLSIGFDAMLKDGLNPNTTNKRITPLKGYPWSKITPDPNPGFMGFFRLAIRIR